MKRRGFVLTLLLACGGTPVQQATVAPLPSANASSAVSDPIAHMWPIAEPQVLVHVDVAGLLGSPLGSRIVPAWSKMLFAELGEKVPATQARCLQDGLAAAKDLFAGTSQEGSIVIIRYDAGRFGSPRACVDASAPAEIAGAREAWKYDRDVVAVASPGVLVAGTPALVEASLRGTGNDPRTLSAVALARHDYARVVYASGSDHAEGSLTLSDALLSLRVSADIDESAARMMESGFRTGTAQAPAETAKLKSGVSEADVARLLGAATLTRTGRRLVFAFELREPVSDQARDLGMIAALAQAVTRDYVLKSKEIEARFSVREIGRSVAEWWEREDGTPRARKKLRSFPPVPKDVPRGVRYATTAADWAAWAPLKFEREGSQYYQYEIRAAKDGMSADVLARGDLDGNGKTSLFKLSITVRKSDHTLVFAPNLVEVDPDE